MAVMVDLLSRLSAAVFRTKGELERLTSKPETLTSKRTSLGLFDITKLGVGNFIGIGVFIITGQVACGICGPAAIISLTIAAIASFLSGMCYAEFTASVPRKLSTVYTYTYILVGEMVAFLVGWCLVLVYSAAVALCARSMSATLDYLLGNPIHHSLLSSVGEFGYFESVPDFLAVGFVVMATLLTVVGVKQSVPCMDICTVFNLTIVLFVVAVGSFYAKPENWKQDGGFAPNGERGIFTGAACCFVAFLGFDIIGTAGKNTHKPARNIPYAIAIVTVASLLVFMGIAVMITLVAPYSQIDADVPLPSAFGLQNVYYVEIIVGVSSLLAILVSLLSVTLPLLGIVIAMAKDRIIFKFLGDTYGDRAVPVSAMLGVGVLAGTAAMLFKMRDLVELVAIGVLLVYSLVCACVIALRYQPEFKLGRDDEEVVFLSDDDKKTQINEDFNQEKRNGALVEVNGNKGHSKTELETSENTVSEHDESEHDAANEDKSKESDVTSMSSDTEDEPETDIDAIVEEYKEKLRVASLTHIEGPFSGRHKYGRPTALSGKIANRSAALLFVWLLAFSFVTTFFFEFLLAKNPWVIFNICLFGVLSILTTAIIARQPENRVQLLYKVPLMPWLPMVALFINLYLLVSLPYEAWVRFVVWMFIGFLIYFLYGICHSREAIKYMYNIPAEDEEHILLKPMPRYEIMAVLMPTQYKQTKNKRKVSDVIYDELDGEDSDVSP